ncbi:signal peptide peptidase SppA [Silvanigrella aquatica]|uniref:Peptidase S49 domain-containing protein n=1 Tax=Silvanigrella aquatica TaxID=1915309 RepID=A0A1L4D0T1_9BACT|nr:signal peptide peptidase SppA [Silvanigrella aquatica]APJ03797.1 hypothetical protein AXG55_07710 [Silvanigrella aquatica]
MNSLSHDQNHPPEKRSNKFLGTIKSVFATIGALTIAFILLLSLITGFAIYSISSGMKSISTSLNPSMASKLSFTLPHLNSPYIAGIRLEGEISSDIAENVIQKLNNARDDKNAIGILFEVNSPGGSVVASQEIYDTIKDITKQKPIVTYVREVAASGAYYSSASSSKIVANRGSIIGSIGVIMNGFEADKLIQFLKVNPVVIKTGALKDTGSPTRPMTEKDKQYLQELIEETRMQFADDVKQARKTSDSTMKFMSDGRVILGPQALNLKLVDAVGTKQTALEQVASLAKFKTAPDLFYYEDIQSFSDLFTQKLSGSAAHILRESILGITSFSQSNSRVPKAEY